MSMVNLAWNVAYPPLWALAWTWTMRRHPAWWRFPFSLGCAGGGDVVGAEIEHAWISVVISAVYVLVAIGIWLRRYGKRRRAMALIGAKTRAIRDAMVRKARQAARPLRVLRPVPQGARFGQMAVGQVTARAAVHWADGLVAP